MKTLLILSVACFAAVSCTYIPTRVGVQTTVARDLLVKQRNLISLLTNVNTQNTNIEQVRIGREYDIYANINRYNNVKAVREFLVIFQRGLLQKTKVFTIFNQKHRDEVVALFHMFYYAKDYETFYNTACWARENFNEGMFVYALNVAVLHRDDCRGIVLPPIYEVYPFFFLNKDTILKGQILNLRRGDLNEKLAEAEGIHKIDNTLYIDTDYTKKTDEEYTLTYFTEDIGLNSYFYYFCTENPAWMRGELLGTNKINRGENYYYFVQQILARYYLERLSNNVDKIRTYSLDTRTVSEYTTDLRYGNGYDFETKYNTLNVDNEEIEETIKDLENTERRIRDAIQSGYVITETGKLVNIRTEEGINILGNLVEENKDSVNLEYYGYMSHIYDLLLKTNDNRNTKNDMTTTVYKHLETMLRDPKSYEVAKKFFRFFVAYKNTLPSYTREQLLMNGVTIENIDVDDLITYFDNFNVDMKNVLTTETTNDMKVFAKVQRLNHQPFDVKINVKSDVTTNAIVRIFLGPKYDNKGNTIDINENRFNFVELDKFLCNLKNGKQTIVRNSRDFTTTTDDMTTTEEILKTLNDKLNVNTEDDLLLNVNKRRTLFPDRLVLPKGQENGMTFQIYVIVSPVEGTTTGKDIDYTTTTNVVDRENRVDGRALGYPFDRIVDENVFYYCNNMFVKDVVIRHKSTENKVENTVTKTEVNRNYDYNTKLEKKNYEVDTNERLTKEEVLETIKNYLKSKNSKY